ncbi:MAG TPA: Hpt domain-containing protein [Accumulibacter sp.]|uniref:Chemotaxis protein CheA n=2 Tax=Candidatus Accumulibacter TaxID=327159 RepID=A0A080M4Q2_9PROT|nr:MULTISPECIES: Hpt domain-containing protein [Candidatus Accumulibacter]KFB76158.1 MAG: Chemotaxis protein CheA [Candidatus Accumulibacter cognatus]HMW56584.1 Hpt domain-containing protein [Accumulibacter sp.]HNC19444.1 Hpt domain-containing protein [Accumulibacter sp.]HNF90674.1 Hpt domain-containing protein [Accumulibacter sp.]
MNAPTDFDIGPLTWVKSEIDLALERGDAALQQFTASAADGNGGDLTQIRFCRTHLHQVQGALTIIGLDGVTQFAEALESLLGAFELQERPATPTAVKLVQGALAALRHYLDDLISGQPNQPLRLLPLYREVQSARGLERVFPTDLFFPDLSVPPPLTSPAPKLRRVEFEHRLHQQRAHFQHGLLSWLRAPLDAQGIDEMRNAVKRIAALQKTASARAFWWVATAFLTALGEQTLPADADARQLCSRIDLQTRRLLEGSNNVAERLMRDALYLVGKANSDNLLVRRVQDTYQLAALMPGVASPAPVAVESVRRRLREAIAATEEAWSRFCAGTMQVLPLFRTHTSTLLTLVEELDHSDYRRLVQAIADVAGLLTQYPSRHTEALAMETATAILLAQNAQENIQYLDSSFAHQVNVMVDRIQGCIAGTPPRPESELPSLDEMSRLAQEKMVVGQVAREITSNLAQIEQVLDGFFRDAEKRADLNGLETPLRQVIGALTMMRHDDAVAVLRQCAKDIATFSEADYVPQVADFENVAEQLSLVGFFVDAMQHGTTDFATFVNKMQTAAARKQDDTAVSVEQELEQQKRDTHALLVALKEQPSDPGLRQEVRQNLTALQKDADLIADKQLGQQTKHVLSALAGGGDAAQQIDAAMATLKQQTPEAPPPSAETIQLAQASAEEVDAELVEIFLDEADEVLASIHEHLRLLHEQPHDTELLTAIRRSAHTLKGSGRMVGLKDFGEAAWSIEQVLNLWLRQEQEVTPALFDLLEQAYRVFLAWVEHLKTRRGHAPDVTGMVALANSLRDGSEVGLLSVLPGEAETPRSEHPAATTAAIPEEAGADTLTQVTAVAQPPRAQLSIDRELAEIFNQEAGAHLATLQREFAVLEKDQSAPTTHEMYRAAHTLAGIAGTVGIVAVKDLAHALELALLRRNHAEHPDSLEAFACIQQAIGALALMLSDVVGQHQPEAAPTLVEILDTLYPEPAVEKPEAPATTDKPERIVSGKGAKDAAAVPADIPVATAVEAPPLHDELDEQLLPLFLEEALDLNQNIATQLHAWRSNPSDGEAVRRLARLFHTLKGSARMAGAMNLGELTHAIETRMQEAQETSSAPLQLIDDIDNAFDVIVQIVERLQHGESADAPVEISDAAASELAAEHSAEGPALAAEQSTTTSPQEVEGEVAAQRATLRVRADLIDRLVNEAGELSIARSRIEGEMRAIKGSLLDLTENVIRLRRQLRDIEIQAELQMQSRVGQSSELHADFDPLEFDRFTRFQELTRMMAESVNDVATVQQNLLKNLDDANAAIVAQARLNREVQQELMSVRMVPFVSIADRLYRIVRQAGKEIGKRANLEIQGAQLELDRTVLEKMVAPLEHMLRNAIVHGLEDAPTRLAKGKPEIGEISLKLAQEGNEIILSLSDDGTGLNLDRLRTRGLSAGLLTEDEARDPTRVVDLIFAPGISTASEVSRLSGRGIGMDVLKSEVNSLGGRIEVLSSPGQGTTFRLYLPLTLAVTKALLVRSSNRQYAIPSAMIEQVLDLKEQMLTRIREAKEAVWTGNHYPFSYLPHLLGETRALPEKHSQYWVLLLRSGSKRIAMQVDELLGNQEIVVKNIGPQLARVIGVDGATVLGNGQVVLILNPIALASRDRTASAVSPVPTVRQPVATDSVTATLPTIMIVDDSLTVRKITSRLLAREGYQVMTAKDGVDALEQLVALVPDVLLVDIEMPRMDGFEFTRNVRADKRLSTVPIIMITSRTADKHRQYAIELGVNHYLGKPYQEEELLRLVAGHVREQRQA